jgi:hypothetical protein
MIPLNTGLLTLAMQLSYVRANDRPLKPWMWELSFLPGF